MSGQKEWKRKPVADEMRGAEASANGAGLAGWLVGWVRRIARNGLGNLQRGRGQRRMELVETLQLGGKRQLMLVVCDGQRYLVGAGGDAVNSIEAMGARPVEEDGRMAGVESDDATGLAMRRTQ
jgi:flagellar biogenesis protein FliO